MKNNKTLRLKCCQLVIMFAIVSFLGYIYECITQYLRTGDIIKIPGFSTLPIIVMYGFGVMILYATLGTPDNIRFLWIHMFTKDNKKNKVLRYVAYFILSALLATIFELIVGLSFEKICGIVFWDYSALPLNYHGYICLQITVIWGFAATIAMKFLFDGIATLIEKIPENLVCNMASAFLFVWLLDTVFNFGYYFTTGNMFSILSYFI